MQNVIIGLTGPKGSGKDTIATQLIRMAMQEGYETRRLAFADPIKKEIQHIFQLNTLSTSEYDSLKRELISFDIQGRDRMLVSGRHVVREIGMLMRRYDEKQFVDYVERELVRPSLIRTVSVITDLRFDNEYTMLRNRGAIIVKVTRPDHHYDGHITERGFDDHLVDFVIENEGSLDSLNLKIGTLYHKFVQG